MSATPPRKTRQFADAVAGRTRAFFERLRQSDAHGRPRRSSPPVVDLIARGSIPGFLLAALISVALSSLTFFVINRMFDVTVFDRLMHWRPYHQREVAEAHIRATGNTLDLNAEQRLRSLELRIINGPYTHPVERVPANTAADGTDTPASAPKPKGASPDNPPSSDAQARVAPIERLANDLPSIDVDLFCFVWSRDPEKFEYVLEISRRDRSASFEIQARYYSVINGEVMHPRFRSHFTILSRRHYRPFSLMPVSVNHSCGELAQRFALQMAEDTRGLPDVKDLVLKQRTAIAELQVFLEQLLLRRIGRENAAFEGPVSVAQTEITNPISLRTDREYESLEEVTAFPRRLNGNDIFGFVQFFTLAAFWAVVVSGTAKWWQVRAQNDYLTDPNIFPQNGGQVDRGIVDSQVRHLQNAIKQFKNHGQEATCVPLEIAYSGYAALKASSLDYKAVPGFVETRMNTFLEQSGTGFSMMRFLVWVIPSIGFIGTVIGIGNALLGTGDVLAGDPLEQQAAIQRIAARLGTAFDTTFVALIVSIPATLLLHVLQRQEEGLIHRSAELTLSSLIDPSRIVPIDHSDAPAVNSTVTAAANPSVARSQPTGTSTTAVAAPTVSARPALKHGPAVPYDKATSRHGLSLVVVLTLTCVCLLAAAYLIRVDGQRSALGQELLDFCFGKH